LDQGFILNSVVVAFKIYMEEYKSLHFSGSMTIQPSSTPSCDSEPTNNNDQMLVPKIELVKLKLYISTIL